MGSPSGKQHESRYAPAWHSRIRCSEITPQVLRCESGARCAVRRRSGVGVVHGAGRSGVGVAHGAECAGAPVWEVCTLQSAPALRCGSGARRAVRGRSCARVVQLFSVVARKAFSCESGAHWSAPGAPVREWCHFSVWLQGERFCVRVAHPGVRRAPLCESGATFQCNCTGSVFV